MGVGLGDVGCFGLGLLNRTSLILTKRKKWWLFLYVGVLQLSGWCRHFIDKPLIVMHDIEI